MTHLARSKAISTSREANSFLGKSQIKLKKFFITHKQYLNLFILQLRLKLFSFSDFSDGFH